MPAVERIVFFGTPGFAVPTLRELCAAGRVPLRVVTQPPRPAGRGRKPAESPVARLAGERGIALLQPRSVRDPGFLAALAELSPDVAVVVAFGQIFPGELLELPRHGCVNLHASLLPRFRGAAPIQAAIAAGEKKTGATTMQMEEGLDSGPILLQEEMEIGKGETAGELGERLAEAGARLVLATLEGLERGALEPREQREDQASYAPRISKDDGKIDWSLEARRIYDRLRAYTPWPGSWAYLQARRVRIVSAVPMDWEDAPLGGVGTYLGLRQGRLAVLCGGNTILGIESLQRPGRKPVRAWDFANGERLRVGERFA